MSVVKFPDPATATEICKPRHGRSTSIPAPPPSSKKVHAIKKSHSLTHQATIDISLLERTTQKESGPLLFSANLGDTVPTCNSGRRSLARDGCINCRTESCLHHLIQQFELELNRMREQETRNKEAAQAQAQEQESAASKIEELTIRLSKKEKECYKLRNEIMEENLKFKLCDIELVLKMCESYNTSSKYFCKLLTRVREKMKGWEDRPWSIGVLLENPFTFGSLLIFVMTLAFHSTTFSFENSFVLTVYPVFKYETQPCSVLGTHIASQ